MIEQWKDIPGYENLYMVSNTGRVKSIRFNKERILKQHLNNGYYLVELCVNNKRYSTGVHRLVAKAFIPNPDNKPEVNHLDRNRQNNNITNLEWCTSSENVADAYKKGVKPRATHQNQPNQKAIIDIINNVEYFSIREAARQLHIKRDTIKRSLLNNTAVCKNTHHFIYKD